MNLKNILRSGDYVIPIPFGAHVTLQYGEQGNLEKMYKGWDTVEEITDEIEGFHSSITTFPQTIAVRSTLGTSWVYGVLYTSSKLLSAFTNPTDAFLEVYKKEPDKFAFFACNVKSTACSFGGYSGMQTWFAANKFNILTGFLAGANYTDSILKHFISSKFSFNYPEFASYLILNGSEEEFIETKVTSYIVEDVYKEIVESGQIIGVIKCSSDKELRYDYSEIVKYNVAKDVCILLDEFGSIKYSYPLTSKVPEVSSKLVCEYCGKPIEVSEERITMCSNPHCLSRMYGDIKHVCNTFEIPLISYEKYLQYERAAYIKHIEDIFALPEYCDLTIHTTLSKLLNAFVPIYQVRNRSLFNLIANNCSNNLQTFLYYVVNPDNICQDFGIDESTPNIKDLIKWFKDSENVATLNSLLTNKNIVFDVQDKKFDGDPILRGKVVFVTGKFNHGSLADIIEILQSYSAEVKTNFDDSINEVLVGDIPEDVSGVSLRKAKKKHIPIFQESGFFQMYDIDNDLKLNLC